MYKPKSKRSYSTISRFIKRLGNYDRIKDLVDKVTKIGNDTDLGTDYIESFEDRVTELKRDVVPTNW